METVLFGEPARTGIVLTSGGEHTVLVWFRDTWRKGSPWRVIREIPWPLKVVGLGLLIGDEGFEGYVN
jgi:hypothetical protein